MDPFEPVYGYPPDRADADAFKRTLVIGDADGWRSTPMPVEMVQGTDIALCNKEAVKFGPEQWSATEHRITDWFLCDEDGVPLWQARCGDYVVGATDTLVFPSASIVVRMDVL